MCKSSAKSTVALADLDDDDRALLESADGVKHLVGHGGNIERALKVLRYER